MKKYTIIGMWDNYNYNNNFFTQKLKNIHQYVNKNNEYIDFLISGPFINNEDYNYIFSSNCKNKILYISEPIEINKPYHLCYELFQKNIFDIIIGCANQISNKIKFPLYINFILDKEKHFFDEMNQYVKNCDIKNKKFCALINTHDTWNTRIAIYNKLKELGHISCPSNLLNNCSNDELNKLGNSNYLKTFLFNICSENTLTKVDGYITEKIVHCCNGGAIPIYCGWFDDIDEKIFNKKRLLFYDPKDEKSLENVFLKVKELMNDKDKLSDFYRQDIYMDNAYETIQKMNINLMDMFKKL
jgi:hypothetical protein